jgi:hypothetical protein
MTLDCSGQVDPQAKPAEDRTAQPPSAGCVTPGQLQYTCLPMILPGITTNTTHKKHNTHTQYTQHSYTQHTQQTDMTHNTHRHTHNTCNTCTKHTTHVHTQHTDMTHNTQTHTPIFQGLSQPCPESSRLFLQGKAELSMDPSTLPDPIDKDESTMP